jgi:hypothetical protein
VAVGNRFEAHLNGQVQLQPWMNTSRFVMGSTAVNNQVLSPIAPLYGVAALESATEQSHPRHPRASS